MTFNAKACRRWFGSLCLLAAILMLAAGETTPGKRLDGVAFISYWLACFMFATLAMLAAILDARALRHEARAEQQALLKTTLEDIERRKHSTASLQTPNSPQTPNSNPPTPP